MQYNIETTSSRIFDCIVCGGGVSGVAAAISAARSGLSVALIEKEGCFGGTATIARVNHLLGGRKYDPIVNQMIRKVGGLFDEITDRLISIGAAVDPDTIDITHNPFGWYPRMAAGVAVDGEILKCLLDDMLLEAGIVPYLSTRVIGVSMQNKDTIESLLLHNKSGCFSLMADTFIDATGDADLAVLCGCPVEKGRDSDGLMTPATLIFHVDSVDGDALVDYQNEHSSPKLVEIIRYLKKSGEWDFPFDIFISIQLHEKDIFMEPIAK